MDRRGISISLAILGFFLLTLAFIAAADAALTIAHSLSTVNTAWTRAVYHVETPWLNPPMVVFTLLGEDPPLDIFALLVAVWAMRRGQRLDGWILIGVAIAARLIGVGMKYAVAQPRPFYVVPPHPLSVLHGYGYPSGHAVLSMAILGFGAFVLVRLLTGPRLRWAVVAVCAALILLIGFSRVYLGFHWVNDVVGGYLDGGFVALGGATLWERLRVRDGS
jgi:membrane-associated phospholipid phosphatase